MVSLMMTTQESSPVDGASKGPIQQYTWTGSLSLEVAKACSDLAGVMTSPGWGLAVVFDGIILVCLNVKIPQKKGDNDRKYMTNTK